MYDLFTQPAPVFHGSDYSEKEDRARLEKQYDKIFFVMKDKKFRTLDEIKIECENMFHENFPVASISAQLRHMRNPKNGGHTVEKQIRGKRENGLYEYQLIENKG